MPSANVSTATAVKAGEPFQLPKRKGHVRLAFIEPLRHAHLAISLSAQVYTGACELPHITDTGEDDVACRPRVETALDELARA